MLQPHPTSLDGSEEDVKPILRRWVEDCYLRAEGHKFYSSVYQALHLVASAPSVVSPMVLTKLVVDQQVNPYALVYTLLALAGATLSLSCSFADKSVRHRQFFNNYSLLAKQIQCELCRTANTASNVQQCIEHWFYLSHLAPNLRSAVKPLLSYY